MNTSHRRNRQRISMFIVGVALTVGGAMVGGGSALAHHPVIEGSATCDGVVSYTATAWVPAPPFNEPEHRGNPNVQVSYQVNGAGASVPLGSGAFTAGNGYSFCGQFTWPGDATSVLLTVVAVGDWDIGTPGGSSWQASVPRPNMPCVTTTTEAATTTTQAATTTTQAATTTTQAATTTTQAATTTTQAATTTTEAATTTTQAATTTTEAATTTTEAATTTTEAATTTTEAATTTTELGSEGPTTSTTVLATTTTVLGSEGPTTTVTRTLPRTGNGDSTTGSYPLMALGLLLIGGSLVLTARREHI